MRILRDLPLLTAFALCSFSIGAAEAAKPYETSVPITAVPGATISTPKTKAATKPAPAPVPKKETLPEPKLTREHAGEEVLAEVVALPPLKAPPKTSSAAAATSSGAKPSQPKPSTGKAVSAVLPGEGTYKMILSGILDRNLEIGVEDSPVLIRGNFAVTENVTLRIKPGTLVHLAADPKLEKPATPDVPDATQSAVVWIWGSLKTEGITGNPVEFINQETTPASLLLYGNEQSQLDGLRLKGATISQTAGTLLWTNCELVNINHYALGGGAAVFTHCTLRNCGGVFATYNLAPWSLMMRRNIFEACREGVVLGSDPGESRLIIEKNHFLNTRGAHLRAMPVVNAKGMPDKNSRPGDLELLIGENWYGTADSEEVEMRLVDRRIDSTVRARLNTRPPAERPYSNTGAGVGGGVISTTLREQQPVQQKLLQAHSAQKPMSTTTAEKAPQAAMSKTVKKPN